jgi:hypothetical protein
MHRALLTRPKCQVVQKVRYSRPSFRRRHTLVHHHNLEGASGSRLERLISDTATVATVWRG